MGFWYLIGGSTLSWLSVLVLLAHKTAALTIGGISGLVAGVAILIYGRWRGSTGAERPGD
jgi:hypothetical protein